MSPTSPALSVQQSLRSMLLSVLVVAIALAWPVLLRAQGDGEFQRLTVEQGLSQSFVYCIFRDSHGFMWFGTRDGLNKYDGYGFTHYNHQPFDSSTIASGVIRSIAEDRSGALWIATFRGGLVRFDRATGRFTTYCHDPADPRSLPSNDVTVVHVDRTGTLWVGTKGEGLSRMVMEGGRKGGRMDDHASFVHYLHDPSDPGTIAQGSVGAIAEDSAGMLWIATDHGIDRFDRATGTFRNYYTDSLHGAPRLLPMVSAMAVDRGGGVWFAMVKELIRIDPATGSRRRWDAPAIVSAIACDAKGEIWVGTQDGAFVLDPATGRRVSYRYDPGHPRSLSGGLVLAIYIDGAGRGWIGTERGIDVIDDREQQFMAYRRYAQSAFPFDGENIRTIYQDRAGMIWIGTAGKGLMSLDRRTGHVRAYDFPTPSSSFVNAIYEDRAGTLWIGTRSGLMRLDRARGRIVPSGRPAGIPDSIYANIWAIEQDRDGMLWVGGVFGLMMIDPVRWRGRMFVNDPADQGSLAYNSVWAIHEDRAGELWIGTPGGLQRYDRRRGTFASFRHDPSNPASLAHNEVWSIFEDHAGTLWIGTWGGGLNRLDRRHGTFEHFTEEMGLPSNVIHGVLEDARGYLWVSGGRGLSRFDPRTKTVANFDVNDGLRNDEFNAHAALLADDGEMFFGGPNGLNSFWPMGVMAVPMRSTPMVITAFRKLDSLVATELFDGATVEVLPSENYFSFEFALLDYMRPEKKRYAYRLEGLDNDWIYSGTRRSAAYTNLEPGEYVFRVRGASGYGVWSREELAVTIRVVPAFWQTVRFRAMAVVGVMAIGLFWNGSRRRRRRQREMALEQAREVERRGIADELHDGPLQDLYSTRFVLAPLMDLAGGEERSRAAELEETLRRVRGSLRNICGTLQLPSFDLGLGSAIEGHLERFREIHPGISVDLVLVGEEQALPTSVRENLFRVYRSAMSNVVKHAAATCIEVRLEAGRRHVLLRVRDNGRGFDPPDSFADLLREQHYGLLLAESHMRAIGGRLDIRSAPGRGAAVLAMLELRRRSPLLVERLKRAALRYRNIHITQSNENRV